MKGAVYADFREPENISKRQDGPSFPCSYYREWFQAQSRIIAQICREATLSHVSARSRAVRGADGTPLWFLAHVRFQSVVVQFEKGG
jgi:hypothetical protein